MKISFEGKTFDMPDDATEEEIQSVINAESPFVPDDLPEMLTDEESARRTAEQKATKEARPMGEKIKDYLEDKFRSGGATDYRNMMSAIGVGQAGPGAIPFAANLWQAKAGKDLVEMAAPIAKAVVPKVLKTAKKVGVGAVKKTGGAIKKAGSRTAPILAAGVVADMAYGGKGTEKVVSKLKGAAGVGVAATQWIGTKWEQMMSDAEERGPSAVTATDYLLQQQDEEYRKKRRELEEENE